jgi:outer membrane receptor for ferric coprogen and ferric-rhodotorulic acid
MKSAIGENTMTNAMTGGAKRASSARRAVGRILGGTAVAAMLVFGAAHETASATEGEIASRLRFDIPAQSIATALLRFSEQAGIQITTPGADTRSLDTSGVQGDYEAAEALQILLRGTGLRFRYVDSGTVVVTAAEASATEAGDGTLRLAVAQATDRGAGTTTQPEPDAESTEGDSGTELDYVLVQGTRKRDELTLGRTGATIRDTPQSVTIMSQARIEAQNLRNLDEVLTQTPGIVLLADSTVENTYTARGHVIESIQYDNITSGTNPETIASPNMAMFDGVEVLRGSNGILNGVNGFGSINLRRKRPLADLQLSTAVTGGSWDRYHVEADVTGPLSDRLRGRAVVSYDDRGFFFPHADFQESLVYGTVDFDLTDSTTLRFATHWQYTDATPNSPGVPFYSDGGDIGLPRSTMLSPAWSNFRYNTKNYMGEVEHEFPGGWKGRLITSYFDTDSSNFYAYHWGGIDRATGSPDPDWGTIFGEQLDLRYIQRGTDLSLWGPVSFFGREHEVLVGAVRSEEHYGWYYADLTDAIHASSPQDGYGGHSLDFIRNWDPTSIPKPDRQPVGYYGPDRYIAQTGVFGRVSLNITDPLTVILGMRVNRYRLREMSFEVTDTAPVAYEDIDVRIDNDLSPQAAVIYDLNERYSLYASYADFLIPQTELSASGRALDPRIAANYEAGIKAELADGRFNASLAFFRVEESSRAVPLDPDLPPTDPSQTYDDSGTSRSEGFEIETSGRPLPNWNLEMGYTYNTTEYVTGDLGVDSLAFNNFLPKHSFKLWSNHRLPFQDGRWSVSGGLSAQSKLTEPVEKDSYAILSLRLGLRLTEKWSASVNVHNVTDETYYLGSYGQANIFQASSGNHFYGDPRSFVLAVRGKF